MKKIFFLIFITQIFSVKISMAQNTIPNNGFETWNSMGSYTNPDGWATMNNSTELAGIYTATKGTPGNPGSSYLKLTSKTINSVVVNGIAVCGRLDSMTMMPLSGFAYSDRPQNFTGKYQHMIFGNSQGSISVTLTKWNSSSGQRDIVATANKTLSGMAMSWSSFTINFIYQRVDFPDSCMIVLKASGSNPTEDDYLWVDNLAFSGTVSGIESSISSQNNMVIYPNPSNTDFFIELNFNCRQQTTIELADLNGKTILAKDVGVLQGESRQTMDISGIAKGFYFVKIITPSGTEVRKIVVE